MSSTLTAHSSDIPIATSLPGRIQRPVTRNSVKSLSRISTIVLLALLASVSAMAMPLSEYRTRLQQATAALDELLDTEDDYSDPGFSARVTVAFEKLKKLVPSDETVEWEGGRVRINNSWLSEELKKYQEMPPDYDRLMDVVFRISERLGALEHRLGELEEQNKAGGVAKDKEKARLEAILRRADYGEKPPEKSLWERFTEWLRSLFPSSTPLRPGQSSWLSTIAMILIFGLAAGVLAYVIWKFAPSIGRKKDSRAAEKRPARVILGERLAADETAADLLAQAEALALKGELRAAIRKGYIALLCELGDRKVLTLAQHKTNHDYLRAVREKRPLLNEMQKLTSSFENHWYGFVPATTKDWTAFRTGYQQTMKTASLLSDE